MEAAGDGKICRFDGPEVMGVGQTGFYSFRVQDNNDDIFDDFGFEDEFSVSINNRRGSIGQITRAVIEDPEDDQLEEGFELDEWRSVGPTGLVNSLDVENPNDIDGALLARLKANYDFLLTGNPCGDSAVDVFADCMREIDTVTGRSFCFEFSRTTSAAQRFAWAEAVEGAMAKGVVNCLDLKDIGHEALIHAGAPLSAAIGVPLSGGPSDNPREYVGGIDAFWLAVCDFTVPSLNVGPVLDDVSFFTVKCTEPGTFELTVSDKNDGDAIVSVKEGNEFVLEDTLSSVTKEIVCKGPPTEKSGFLAFPNIVEMVPSPGNVSHSLVLVSLLDEHEQTPASGYDVEFLIDRCSIETSGVDSAQELADAVALFSALNPTVPASSLAVETSAAARSPVDSDRRQDVTKSFDIGDPVVSRAGAIVGCSAEDAPDATPGVATITVIIALPDQQDVVLRVQILVVGPPKEIAMEARPATMRCGEKAQVTVQVKDATGQPVSDNTRIEAVTNAGGILAGTGAVAANENNVVPISSTVTSTVTQTIVQNDQPVRVGGLAIFYLLTSELHTGPYEVVVTSGGTAPDGKGFITPPVSQQVTVNCVLSDNTRGAQVVASAPGQEAPPPAAAQPAPQPTITAPRTGSQITPPNTGDAGLKGNGGLAVWNAAAIFSLSAAVMAAVLATRGRVSR